MLSKNFTVRFDVGRIKTWHLFIGELSWHDVISYLGEREGGGRFSMWGEQLHDKLFAKKDMKEVMRNKLKFNLRDENNDNPQSCHTDIKWVTRYLQRLLNIVNENFIYYQLVKTKIETFALSLAWGLWEQF